MISTGFLLGKNTWNTNWCSHPENKGDLLLVAPAGNTKILVLPAAEPRRSRRLLLAGFGLCRGELPTASPAPRLLCEVLSHPFHVPNDLQGYVPRLAPLLPPRVLQAAAPSAGLQPCVWSRVELQDISNSKVELWV